MRHFITLELSAQDKRNIISVILSCYRAIVGIRSSIGPKASAIAVAVE